MKYFYLFLLYMLVTGCSLLKDNRTDGFVRYRSAQDEVIYVSFVNNDKTDIVDIRLGNGNLLRLDRVISGSGARYSDGKYILWNKGDKITLYQNESLMFTGSETN